MLFMRASEAVKGAPGVISDFSCYVAIREDR
jgi:hypothetical protein